jgi:Ti-type conjugative transfer relaxase TraA
VAAAAYRSGSLLADRRTGLTHDYTGKRGVLHSEIVMPSCAGDWRPDRDQLWNAAEKANGRGDAVIAREFEISLPHELDAAQRKVLGLDFAKYVAEKFGVACDIAFHAPNKDGDERNYHMHIMATAKRVKGDGFGTKALELDPISCQRFKDKGPNGVAVMREVWAALANNALEAAGLDVRIDHRTLEAQGKDAQPTVHLGPAASAMERDGEVTDLGEINRAIKAENDNRARLKAEHAAVSAEIIDLEAEREKRTARDPAALLAKLTRNNSTFTRFDVNRAARAGFEDVKERAAFVDSLLARDEIIPLRERGSEFVSRYTTRDVIALENRVLENVRAMQLGDHRGASAGSLRDAMRDFPFVLDDEQRRAVTHLTGDDQFAILAGAAGTGKSAVMSIAREAYEADGFKVIGLSHTNKVVEAMRADGFDNVATVTAELNRLTNDRGQPWDKRTVVFIDEAAQLSTQQQEQLTRFAKETGAAVREIGHDKQFSSIERPGMFRVLQDEHGAAELHTVYRVKDADQKAAFTHMEKGEFREGLAIYDRIGSIKWSADQDASKAALIQRWADDREANPGKRQTIIAYTNLEVDDMNARARAELHQRGLIGEDVVLKTRAGEQAFAPGDQVVFTATTRNRAQKAEGLYNNSTGTITAIEQDERGATVSLRLDARGRDGEPRHVSFRIGEDERAGEFNAIKHGYAGTTYKVQGDTVPLPYMLHSAQWRAAAGYVGSTRQSETLMIFAAEKADAWMMAEGGASGLSEKHLASAQKSYDAWAEAKPELAAKYGFESYVSYVQDQWAQEKDAHRLDRMAQQMGRVEERRAASAFEQGFAPTDDITPTEAAKPYSRYAALDETTEALNAEGADERQAEASKPASEPGKPADRPMTADERFAARMAKVEAEVTKKPDGDKPQDIREYVRERGYDPGRTRGPSR